VPWSGLATGFWMRLDGYVVCSLEQYKP